MTIIHIVLFKIKPLLDESAVKDVCDRMLNLKAECIHPETQKPYIVNSSGGRDISIEGKQAGFTHGFVVEFASKEDRDYYVSEDKAHLGFVDFLGRQGVLDDVKVVDYEVGLF